MEQKHILDYLDETRGKRELKSLFQIVMDEVLKELKLEGAYEVSLSLVSKEKIHELNKEYRNIDRPTDVLTFAFQEADVLFDEPLVDLGSILISPEIAKAQAKEYHHPYYRELAFLFIHGLLHSLGYDHMEEKEAEEMFALQNKILNQLPYDFYTDMNKVKKLLKVASSRSKADYSSFHVGAVVLTKDGKYHLGCNIENSAYPVTICAERCALFVTYSLGYHKEDIISLSLVTSSKNLGTPCGSCRQVMSELMDMKSPVYIFNCDYTKMMKTSVEELLPFAFTKEDLHA